MFCIKRLAMVMVVFVLASCIIAPFQAYDGPARDPSEVAIINNGRDCGRDGYFQASRFLRIDDVILDHQCKFAVSPGRHTLTMEYQKEEGLMFGVGAEYPTISLELEVIAGRYYTKEYAELESPVPSGMFTKLDARQFIWFWDSVDEKVAGGYRPQQITQVLDETPCWSGCYDTMKKEYYEDDWERGYVVTRGRKDEPN